MYRRHQMDPFLTSVGYIQNEGSPEVLRIFQFINVICSCTAVEQGGDILLSRLPRGQPLCVQHTAVPANWLRCCCFDTSSLPDGTDNFKEGAGPTVCA